MKNILAIALGATMGAALRHYVGVWAVARWGADFPWGTLLVNMAGSFVLGFFLTIIATRPTISPIINPTTRLLIATGFCGSLTTFSTYSYEGMLLWQRGAPLVAALYMLGSLIAGVLCVMLGVWAAQWVQAS